MKNKKGFTLIEIIVTVTILAVLMAISVPTVMNFLGDSNKGSCDSHITELQSSYAYAVKTNKYSTALENGTFTEYCALLTKTIQGGYSDATLTSSSKSAKTATYSGICPSDGLITFTFSDDYTSVTGVCAKHGK